jgi:hypothetical protein
MYFDIFMPLTLFFVTLASLYLNSKTESKLKTTLEEKEFKTRDAVLLVVLMAVMVFVIAIFRDMTSPLMILFMFSYSMLLFIFTYLFSNKRWFVAIIPPAVFVLLYWFLRGQPVWFDYLVNVYGVIFAILITLYISTLFTWKTTLIFSALLTVMDVVMVLVTGAMVKAAQTGIGLELPITIALPIIPLNQGNLWKMYLGLGDFFFAGLLAVQTFKKYGKRYALLSAIAMTLSFFIGEIFLLTYIQRAFPATLIIIPGWLLLALFKILRHEKDQQGNTKAVNSQ